MVMHKKNNNNHCYNPDGSLNNERFNEMFSRVIRGELNNVDDPRGGYTPQGYRKTGPQQGPGPFQGETTYAGLDDIGQGKK
jgi:hypothetical protein